MATKSWCRILAVKLCAASALRHTLGRQTDCYSVYDGKPLLQFSPETKAEYDEIMDRWSWSALS